MIPPVFGAGEGKTCICKIIRNTYHVLQLTKRRLSELGFCSKITKVFGVLDTKDITSWQYSLPMYLKFAQNIMVEDIVCLINGNPVENENMVSEAYNLNKQKIAVRFEFRRANIL